MIPDSTIQSQPGSAVANRTQSGKAKVSRTSAAAARLVVVGFALTCLCGGCASIRVTDPPRTATEQFLLSGATVAAIEQLSADTLRGRAVYVDTSYLTATREVTPELSFLTGELRARLLLGGVRLVPDRKSSEIVLEVRSGGVGIDRLEFLLGIPASAIPGVASITGGLPVGVPELALLKTTTQRGFASVAYVAYWTNTGEILTASGPAVGRTFRIDTWIFGAGPTTTGDIPPAQRVQD